MNYLLKGLKRSNVWVADTALEDHPLHIKQNGLKKKKSTETAISNTVNKIEKQKLMVKLNSNLRDTMQAPKPKLSKWAYTGVVRPKLHDVGELYKNGPIYEKA